MQQGPPPTSWAHTAETHFDKGAAINGIRWDVGPGTLEPADLEGGVRRDRGSQPLDNKQVAAQRRRRLWLAAAGIALLLVGIGIGAGIGFGVGNSNGGCSDAPPQEGPAMPTPGPAAAASSVREGGPCKQDAECRAANSTCIWLVANAVKIPPGICTSLKPDGAACKDIGSCYSSDCDIGGVATGSQQCLITLGEPCSTGKQCAAVGGPPNLCVEGLCTEPPTD